MTDDQLLWVIQQRCRGIAWRTIAKALSMDWRDVRNEYQSWFASKLD